MEGPPGAQLRARTAREHHTPVGMKKHAWARGWTDWSRGGGASALDCEIGGDNEDCADSERGLCAIYGVGVWAPAASPFHSFFGGLLPQPGVLGDFSARGGGGGVDVCGGMFAAKGRGSL